MKSFLINRKQTASFKIAGLMLAIAPLCLMLDTAYASAQSSSTPSPADWTQFLRDNMQRWNPYETILGVNNVGTLGLKWGFVFASDPGDLESSPAVVNGVVYSGSLDGNVYGLNATTGAKLWSFAVGSFVLSSPAVASGVVYVGSSLRAIRRSDGDASAARVMRPVRKRSRPASGGDFGNLPTQ
ncbi:MAG: PQQ-binding-like beta-propeller repeat protein [Alloacidobacterium sp.]|jgi:glucose dehydrogenase